MQTYYWYINALLSYWLCDVRLGLVDVLCRAYHHVKTAEGKRSCVKSLSEGLIIFVTLNNPQINEQFERRRKPR